ncbi:MAG: hypothetical protein ACLRSW_08665 [Christensenellaceae bacterium]
MLEFLPDNVKEALKHVNLNRVYEIRLRAGKPVTLNYEGKYRYLGAYGPKIASAAGAFRRRRSPKRYFRRGGFPSIPWKNS